MKILITGNLGYVGTSLVGHLRACWPEAELCGFDMGLFAHCLTGNGALAERNLNAQYYGDVRRFPAHLLAGVDAVINLAAISNDPMGKEFEEATLAVNYHATVQLAKLCRAHGVKNYVLASSCSMYGVTDDAPKQESDALNPLTTYARSKVYAERDLQDLATDDFVVTCCRFATACGFNQRLRLDLALNDFVAGAIAEKKITVLSDGTPWRPLIHVNDMARALHWATLRGSENGGAFVAVNTGSNRWNYQVKHLAEAVADCIPGVSLSINKDAPPDKRSYRVNFDLYESLAPDHQPVYDLASAIADLQEGLQRMNFTDVHFRESHLIRHQMLKHHKKAGLLDALIAWKS